MFELLFSEIIDSDGDIETEKCEIVRDSFKKESEEMVVKKENPASLFFKTFWEKVKRCFSCKERGIKEISEEALSYPEDEVRD